MGRRSRKRALVDAPTTTRAERDAARRARSRSGSGPRPRRGRRGIDERPPPPWGKFPLTELVILLGIALMTWGFVSRGSQGNVRLAAGLALASLGGLELASREHLAGYRSHSSLLAGAAALLVVTVLALGPGPHVAWALLIIALVVFAAAFYSLRKLFKRRSGGLGFR